MSPDICIPVVEPFPWESILSYLNYRSTPGLERVEADSYTRQTQGGTVSAKYDRTRQVLVGQAQGTVPPDWPARLATIFDTAHNPRPVERVLGRCPVLRQRLAKLPGVRAPGCWEPFELCLRVVLGQQVSVRAAHTLMGRLSARCPGLDPGQVADADLGALGLTRRRTATVRQLAEAVAGGQVRLNGPSWDEISGELRGIPGFGPWTLDYLAIRLGRDADAFPAADLGLLRAMGARTPAELLKLAEPWRPYRGYAAMHLWTVHL